MLDALIIKKMTNKTYNLSVANTISKRIINNMIRQFWNDVYLQNINKNPNIHISVIFKVYFEKDSDGMNLGYKSLSPKLKLNYTDLEEYIDYMLEKIGILSESYHIDPIKKIVFSYNIEDGPAPENRIVTQLRKDLTKSTCAVHSYNNYVLPLSIDPKDYGKLVTKSEDQGILTQVLDNNKHLFKIEETHTLVNGEVIQANRVTIKEALKLTWVDTLIDSNIFIREVSKNTLTVRDGLIMHSTTHPCSGMCSSVFSTPFFNG